MSVFTPVVSAADHPAQATAATAETFIVGRVPFDATAVSASIIPDAALTADATNNRTFTLTNRKQDGTGTAVVATLVTNVAGGNWVARDEKPMTMTAVAADLVLAAGNILEMVETDGGTGVAHPQMAVEVRATHR